MKYLIISLSLILCSCNFYDLDDHDILPMTWEGAVQFFPEQGNIECLIQVNEISIVNGIYWFEYVTAIDRLIIYIASNENILYSKELSYLNFYPALRTTTIYAETFFGRYKNKSLFTFEMDTHFRILSPNSINNVSNNL